MTVGNFVPVPAHDPFEVWLARVEAHEKSTGREPWTRDPEERRMLWERKYSRPAPPVGLFTDLADIRGTS